MAETASLRLHVNRDDSKLAILDKRTGKLWTSNPLEALSDQKTILDDAVFQLNYTNARRQMTNLASSASEKPDLTFSNIQDGVRVVYDIPKLKLNITVDYAIKEEPRQDVPGQSVAYLQVTLPEGAVKEGGDCSNPTSTTCFMVVTLEMLPLFGAAKVGSDGYLMIPDESGAIVTFKPEYPQYRQRYSAAVYGADAAGQAFSGTSAACGSTFRNDRPRMPIWGLKDGDAAYAGIITKGQYQTNVNGYLAGYITNANRASAEFIYRRQASIPRRRTLFVNRIEDNQIPGERQVRYVLLPGEDAYYAGMAKAYRDYLMKSRQLKKLPDQPARPLVDLYMGALRRSAFQDDFIPMTTFPQAQAIIQQLHRQGDEGLRRAAHRLERRRGAGLLAPALPGGGRAGGQRRPARLHRLRPQERGQGLPPGQLPLRLHHLLRGHLRPDPRRAEHLARLELRLQHPLRHHAGGQQAARLPGGRDDQPQHRLLPHQPRHRHQQLRQPGLPHAQGDGGQTGCSSSSWAASSRRTPTSSTRSAATRWPRRG